MISFPLPQDGVVKAFRVPVRALLKARNDGTLHPSDLVSLPPNKIGYPVDAVRKLMQAGVISREFEHLLPGQMVQTQRYPQPVPQSRPAEILDPWEQREPPRQPWKSPSELELYGLEEQLSGPLYRPNEDRRMAAVPRADYRKAILINGDVHLHFHQARKAAAPPALPAVTRQQKDVLLLAMTGLCMVTLLAAIVQSFKPIVIQTGGGYERIR